MRKPRPHFILGTLLALGGCSQIIGLSDYDVNPTPDATHEPGGGEGGAPAGEGGVPAGAGNQAEAGETSQPPSANGGQGGTGGNVASGGSDGGATSSPPGGGGEAGAPPQPACTSSKCCEDMGGVVVATELLVDGDFENAPDTWGTSSSTTDSLFTKVTDKTVDANSGTWFAWLGGSENDISVLLSPEFKVPRTTGWLVLSGYHWLKFDSTGTGDSVYVEMYDANSDFMTPEETFFSWTTSADDTSGWELFSREIPVKTYAGQSYEISVTSSTDDMHEAGGTQTASNFFFDDLSFKAFTCRL